MPLSIMQMLGMSLRKAPIGKIRKALAVCEGAGLAVTGNELEAHFLAGGDPIVVAEALATAKQLGVDANLSELTALDLMRRNLSELMLEATTDRTMVFDTFSPRRPEKIRGFTRDQREVHAAVTVVYRLSLMQLAFKFDSRQLHERLGAAVSVFINTAPDFATLQLKKAEQEAELHGLGVEVLPAFRSVTIEYR